MGTLQNMKSLVLLLLLFATAISPTKTSDQMSSQTASATALPSGNDRLLTSHHPTSKSSSTVKPTKTNFGIDGSLTDKSISPTKTSNPKSSQSAPTTALPSGNDQLLTTPHQTYKSPSSVKPTKASVRFEGILTDKSISPTKISNPMSSQSASTTALPSGNDQLLATPHQTYKSSSTVKPTKASVSIDGILTDKSISPTKTSNQMSSQSASTTALLSGNDQLLTSPHPANKASSTVKPTKTNFRIDGTLTEKSIPPTKTSKSSPMASTTALLPGNDQLLATPHPTYKSPSTIKPTRTRVWTDHTQIDKFQTTRVPDITPIISISVQPFYGTTANPPKSDRPSTITDTTKTSPSKLKPSQTSVRFDVYPINKDETVTPIRFDATIQKTFESSLTNKSSDAFINLAREFKFKLALAFQNLSKFQSIDIIGFKNGSTTCQYDAVFKGLSKETPISVDEIEPVQRAINLSKIDNFIVYPGNMEKEIQTAMDILKMDGCKILRNPCPAGFFCSSTGGYLTCVSYCLSKENKQHPCENGGHCFHDSLENTTNCRCAEDAKYVYSGRYCQIRAEKLALSSTYIIVISVSAGGGTILIFVIIIVVLIVKRRKSSDKKPPMGDKYERQSSYSMSEINIDRWNNPAMSRSRGSTLQNEYQSGLPDTKYVSGREHRVLKSDHGEEIYMYQPSMQLSNFHSPSLGPSDIETRSTRAESTYNYIDTEITYQIKRPSVKVGYLNRI